MDRHRTQTFPRSHPSTAIEVEGTGEVALVLLAGEGNAECNEASYLFKATIVIVN